MQNEGAGALRQKPAGTVGRARDAGRDKLIQEAALALLSELGPGCCHGSRRARAGVGKATVYRRWSTLADLIADATDTLVFPAVSNRDHPGLLRDDLIDSWSGRRDAASTPTANGSFPPFWKPRCEAPTPSGIAGSGRSCNASERPWRALSNERAVSRGELEVTNPDAGGLGGESVLLAVAVGLMVNFPHITGRPIGVSEFERIVDEALLPLLKRAR